KFSNLGRKSTGRNSNVSRAGPQTPRRIDDSNGAHHVLEICQRLAHSHEHDVVDLFSGLALDCNDLIDDFVRVQIPAESFQTARAKFTAISAAYLGGNADCSPIRA